MQTTEYANISLYASRIVISATEEYENIYETIKDKNVFEILKLMFDGSDYQIKEVAKNTFYIFHDEECMMCVYDLRDTNLAKAFLKEDFELSLIYTVLDSMFNFLFNES